MQREGVNMWENDVTMVLVSECRRQNLNIWSVWSRRAVFNLLGELIRRENGGIIRSNEAYTFTELNTSQDFHYDFRNHELTFVANGPWPLYKYCVTFVSAVPASCRFVGLMNLLDAPWRSAKYKSTTG